MAIALCLLQLKLRFAWRLKPLVEFALELSGKEVQHPVHLFKFGELQHEIETGGFGRIAGGTGHHGWLQESRW
ncbi:MAG: hypothetical protein IPG54_02885 [Sphingomonadales bacterium]|jgi:hypothetical protein|nr:hypothetical protein [Sphingomonadales bacterium]MBK9003282.1 hypothetical protein [Sphingomonadales bacterium]MBK9268530.1 hypothetical protein [Sphingomonadales bacterium]MBP6433721.1 hypothetical protein [Sphingorhabdus sp.]